MAVGDAGVPVAALKDERFQLAEFSRRRLRLRLARARLEDEGGYFCQLYADDTHHQIATLTVLGKGELLQTVKEFIKFITDENHSNSLVLFFSFSWTCRELGLVMSLGQR